MQRRILFQIRLRELEQRGGRAEAIFLQMHERARELDQALVKISIHAVPIRQPQMFEDVVRLVKFLLVEQREITGVARVNARAGKLPRQFGDAFVFAHAPSLAGIIPAETTNERGCAYRRCSLTRFLISPIPLPNIPLPIVSGSKKAEECSSREWGKTI